MRKRLLIAAILALALPAQAHHMKGLPHFGYKDMGWYPQIPSKETIRRLGNYLVVATTVPGEPKARAQVNMHVYVKDLKADKPLDRPIRFSVSRKKFFLFTETVFSPVSIAPIMEQYNFARTYEQGGDYLVHLGLPDGSQTGIPVKVAP